MKWLLVLCLCGCGDDVSSRPDSRVPDMRLTDTHHTHDGHQIICGDDTCDYPIETQQNCPSDCFPKGRKQDNPFVVPDPGWIDPVR